MATAVPATGADQPVGGLGNLLVQDLEQFPGHNLTCRTGYGGHGEVCAICLEKIELEETALIKGCEHAYCVTCILHWATYKEKPTCPQCKHPLEFLNIHRSLDGSLHDYMLEESVCLLLRAVWFKPLDVEDYAHAHEESEDYNPYGYDYDYDYDDEDEIRAAYLGNSSSSSSSSSGSVRIGNRRWGGNGYVRGGRQEARPVANRGGKSTEAAASSGTSSSRQQPNKQQKEAVGKEGDKMGRRAKRALKREAEDKAAAAKHQTHLERLGLGRN